MFAFSCNPEQKPSDEDENPQEKPVEKSKACRILSLSVASGSVVIEGIVFEEENYVELSYDPEQSFALSNATATVTISDKATIAPDPATIKDWTNEVKLTVTAEDATTAKEYTVKPAVKQYIATLEKEHVEKLAVEMGAATQAMFGGNLHAFCDVDKFADAAGNVFDLTLTKIGTLNMTGVGDGVIASMGNDDYGVLVAAVAYSQEGWTGTPTSSGDVVCTKFFAWPDGYDKAPVEIYSNPNNVAQYLNVTGDYHGDMYAFAYTDGRQGEHHVWSFHNGSRPSGEEWRMFNTGMLDNRPDLDPNIVAAGGSYFYAGGINNGLSSGQNVSAIEVTPGADGKPDGGIYVFASASPEWDGNTGGSWWRLGGSLVYVRKGIDGEDIAMPGALYANKLITDQLKHGGPHEYGNTDFVAGIKAFNYSGTRYAAIAHVGVQNIYLTIQNIDYYLENKEPQYLLSSVQALKTAATNNKPSIAYVFNSEKGEGYIVAGYIAGLADATASGYVVYKLTRTAI